VRDVLWNHGVDKAPVDRVTRKEPVDQGDYQPYTVVTFVVGVSWVDPVLVTEVGILDPCCVIFE
jgi:hypothetical protein